MSSDSVHRLSCGCQVILGPSHHGQTWYERKYLLGQVDSKHTWVFKWYFWIGFKSVWLLLIGSLLVYLPSIFLFFSLISMTNDIENIPNNRLIFKLNDYPKFEIRWFTIRYFIMAPKLSKIMIWKWRSTLNLSGFFLIFEWDADKVMNELNE